jgi:hypothetical protein
MGPGHVAEIKACRSHRPSSRQEQRWAFVHLLLKRLELDRDFELSLTMEYCPIHFPFHVVALKRMVEIIDDHD